MARPCMIVDSKYCARVAVELAVVRESDELMKGNFVITDIKGNLLFIPYSGLDDENKMILLDGSRSPVLTLRKRTSLHGRFQVYRGQSTKDNDLLYTVKRLHMINVKTKVDVFLSHNTEKKICDFRIEGTCFKRSCAVYAGESDVIVAERERLKIKRSMEKPFVVVDQVYCSPVRVDLAVIREKKELKDGNFLIKDDKGNILFEPMSGLTENKMILLDGSGSPVLTMKKMMSLHGRWQVFRGESTEENDLLYSVKRSLMVNVKTKVDVFLGHNKEEEICDYRVKGTLFMRDCVVYAGKSDTIVAQMHKKQTVEGGVDSFTVTVYPNFDSAFMVSLVFILDYLIRKDRFRAQVTGQAAVHMLSSLAAGSKSAQVAVQVAIHIVRRFMEEDD